MPVNVKQTPPGRIVWGHPLKPDKKKNDDGKVITNDAGEPVLIYTFGLAIPKDQCQPIFDAMNAAAAEEYPNGPPETFAWKFKDGDTGKDSKGNPLKDKEGNAGCFIFALSQQLPVANYDYDHGSGRWVDCDSIKRGDWVTVELDVKAHKPINAKAKAGLYLNQRCVMLHHRDKEIQGGAPDPNARGFAPPPQQTPPASAAPPGSTSPPTPPATGAPSSAPASGPPGGAPPSQHRTFLNGPKPDQ